MGYGEPLISVCSNMEKLKIYFVVSHPIQYFIPLYQRISQIDGIETKVFFFSDETLNGGVDKQFGVKFTWDIPLLEGYSSTFIKNRSWNPSIFKGFWGLFNPGIIRELWNLPKGMVIISGWHFSSYILTYLFATLFGHMVAIRCEAPGYKEQNRNGLKNMIRHYLIGSILLKKLVDIYLYLGNQSREFYRHFKVEESRMVFSPYSIDNDRFKRSISSLSKSHERRKLDMEVSEFIILFTGKFISVKRPLDLIRAFHALEIPNKRLVLVGEGNLKGEMLDYISTHRVERVHFAGFINQSELPKYYCIADVLVLCSQTETWGLSVNEAMACGLPVIGSEGVGCSDDLIQNGRNGYVFPVGNIEALTKSLYKIALDKVDRARMGMESIKIINGYSLDKTAEGIVVAAEMTMRKPGK